MQSQDSIAFRSNSLYYSTKFQIDPSKFLRMVLEQNFLFVCKFCSNAIHIDFLEYRLETGF